MVDQVNIEVGATTSDAEAKLSGLGHTIEESMGKAGESMSGFSALTVAAGQALERFAEVALEKVKEAITESIHAFAEYGEEIGKMQRILGGTTESLSILDTGLKAVGISSESYEHIAARIALRMNTNQAAFEKYGISVKDSSGKVKDATTVISEITAKLAEYEAGTSRNTIASQLLGRGFITAADLMKLTKERMQEATQVAKDFGLVLSEKDVNAAEDFSFKTTLLGEALHGLYITIGRELDPALTEMAEGALSNGPIFMDSVRISVEALSVAMGALKDIVTSTWEVIADGFKAIGEVVNLAMGSGGEVPTAFELFKDTLQVIEVFIVGFRNAFVITFAIIAEMISLTTSTLKTFASVADAALRGDWSGVKAAWKSGTDEITAIVDHAYTKITESAQKSHDDINNIMAGGYKSADNTPEAKTKKLKQESPEKKNTGDTRLAVWKDELKQKLEAEEDYFKTSLDEDEAFWQHKLTLATGHSKADLALRRAINSELYNIHKTQAQQAAQVEQEKLAYSKQMAESDLNLQKETLKEEQSISDDDYAHSLITTKQYYANKLAIETESINASIAAKKKQLDDTNARTPIDEREALKIQIERAKLEGEINVLIKQRGDLERSNNSQERDAENARLAANNTTLATDAKSAADAKIALEQQTIKQMESLHEIDAQTSFAMQQDEENKGYQALVEYNQRKLTEELRVTKDIIQTNLDGNARKEEAERQHESKMTKISNAAVLQRKQYSIQADQSIQSSFESLTFDMMDGVKKWSDLLKNFALNVIHAFQQVIAQKFAEKIFGSRYNDW